MAKKPKLVQAGGNNPPIPSASGGVLEDVFQRGGRGKGPPGKAGGEP